MNSIRRMVVRVLAVSLLWVVAGQPTNAQPWPSRPIVLVIGFASGTGDAVGRVFAEFASKQLGQPVLVESRPGGGGGIVAALGLSKAAPDGYTLGLQVVGPVILRPILDPAVGYAPLKSFSPIVLVGDTPNIILGGSKLPAQSVKDVVAWAKKNPGRLTVGHPGPGSMGHLAALLLASHAGIGGTYIAYRNVGQMVVDLVGGQIDIGVAAYTPQHKAARILAVMTDEPVEFLPGVPTMREAGFAGVNASTWFGLYGPPGLPPEIAAKLNSVANAFLHDAASRQRLAAIGFRGLGGTPANLTKRMVDDTAIWSKVIKDADIKLDIAR